MVTTTMVRMTAKTTIGLIAALMTVTGLAVAQGPIDLVSGEGGGEIAGEVAGGYHADASGALDAAKTTNSDLQDQASSQWKQANSAYEEAREDAWQTADNAEPATPQIEGEERVFDELDQTSSIQASHADKIEKAADLETDYVDAGADLSGAAKADAWFDNLFTGLKDAYTGLKGMMTVDTSAKEDVKEEAYEAIHADDELRGQITDALDEKRQLPDADPKLDGELSAQHASQVTSKVVGQGEAHLP